MNSRAEGPALRLCRTSVLVLDANHPGLYGRAYSSVGASGLVALGYGRRPGSVGCIPLKSQRANQEVAMAIVQGIKEKVHLPIYDCFFLPGPKNGQAPKTFVEMMADPPVIRFFVDVQQKTTLETNLQVGGQWADQSTFEVRTLRVVMSSPSSRRESIKEPVILSDLINNSVVTLIVGEKIMIQAPTWFFAGGAGITSSFANVSNYGESNPMAAVRFSEPVVIDSQQNFRVEMSFPHGLSGAATQPEPDGLAGLKGPFRIWVVLDGSLTRKRGNRRNRRSGRKR
jgi:hypothetical protein